MALGAYNISDPSQQKGTVFKLILLYRIRINEDADTGLFPPFWTAIIYLEYKIYTEFRNCDFMRSSKYYVAMAYAITLWPKACDPRG